jgi:hypothetical protein
MRQTSAVTFHRNIGMLVVRQTRSIQGNMCETCIGRKFWDFTVKNIVFGPGESSRLWSRRFIW